MLAHVGQHGIRGLGERDPARQVGEQARRGVHLAHHVAHLVKRLGRRLDDQVNAVVEQVQLGIGHEARDLDQRVPLDVQPSHLAVDPHQPVVHPNYITTFSALPNVHGLTPARHSAVSAANCVISRDIPPE